MKSILDLNENNNIEYIKLLTVIAKLSKLFSNSSAPFLQYRIAENLFCKCYDVVNLSRKDTAFDAKYGNIGVGIKTFVMPNNVKSEKIAEFNKLSSELNVLNEKDLAERVSLERNKRILSGMFLDGIESSIYHIIARKTNQWIVFETNYDLIDIKNIHSIKKSKAGIQFKDSKNDYSYNFSKSTLYRKFEIPLKSYSFPVTIINDPFDFLSEVLENKTIEIFPKEKELIAGIDFIILPLYGYKKNPLNGLNERFVYTSSGLNQWHSKPRKGQVSRGLGEVYIPVPSKIHKLFPDFFPPNLKGNIFDLEIPTGEIFKAKMCQDQMISIDGVKINKGKGLMTNPNKSLSVWLLRNLLQLAEGELATIEKLENIGFDSVVIYKINKNHFKIDKAKSNSYEDFIIE